VYLATYLVCLSRYSCEKFEPHDNSFSTTICPLPKHAPPRRRYLDTSPSASLDYQYHPYLPTFSVRNYHRTHVGYIYCKHYVPPVPRIASQLLHTPWFCHFHTLIWPLPQHNISSKFEVLHVLRLVYDTNNFIHIPLYPILTAHDHHTLPLSCIRNHASSRVSVSSTPT
jgi:hypothetical protein